MLLAGDIGGTKTLLGVFDAALVRPRPLVVRSFGTVEFDDLTTMIAAFLDGERIDRGAVSDACFGVAGPIIEDAATLTNVAWRVESRRVAEVFGLRRVSLLNDLEAMAYAVPVLGDHELEVLQVGEAMRHGNMALIAAGTGLGEALLHNVDGRFIPSASEGGHADFAARTGREIGLLQALAAVFGRVDVERVVSGRGLVNIYTVTHAGRTCAAGIEPDDPEAPAAVSRAALESTCANCVEALDIFVDAYGAEAGNLALRSVATGGVFVGGGIAPKILPALTNGPFMDAFRAKAPLDAMVKRIPVKVILNPHAGLLGAAVYAAAAP